MLIFFFKKKQNLFFYSIVRWWTCSNSLCQCFGCSHLLSKCWESYNQISWHHSLVAWNFKVEWFWFWFGFWFWFCWKIITFFWFFFFLKILGAVLNRSFLILKLLLGIVLQAKFCRFKYLALESAKMSMKKMLLFKVHIVLKNMIVF